VIPHELTLSNFMCYRRAHIDFSGIHVACLSGENGAGKSALLDAMTWAVWGKARARRDDELIRLGQEEMEVTFAFGLGGDRYRVVRKRKAGKRGQSALDFQIRDDDRWRSVAENTIRDTQAKIERVLRLDYDTFVNSAFLRQGQADEFTVKTPAERKRVLGEILGLDAWSVYEERVKERLRSVQIEVAAIDHRLVEIEEELSRRPEYEAMVAEAQAEVAELVAALREVEKVWQEMETQRAGLRHLRAQQDELEERILRAERELSSIAEEREQRKARLAELHELVERAGEIELGYAAYQAAVERERALGEKLTALADLNQQRGELETRIAEERHTLQTMRELVAQRVADLEARLATEETLQEHADLQVQLAHLHELRRSREAARDDLSRLVQERATRQTQNEALRAEMDVLKERIDTLKQAEADCPLCGRPLAEDDRLRLVEDLQAQGKAMGDTFRGNRARFDAISNEAEVLQKQIAEQASLLEALPQLEQRVARVAVRVRQGEEAAKELETACSELAKLDIQLGEERYAPVAREALAEVLAQAAVLGYDAEAHEAVRQAIDEGKEFAERKTRLDAAQASISQEEDALARLEESTRHRQAQIDADRARQKEHAEEMARLEEHLREAPAIEEKLGQMRTTEAEARRKMGAAEQRLAACDVLAQQQTNRRERRQRLAYQASLHEDLRTAFGVHGVPAMIIEAVVPEIETEANRLLGRMTAGRMHVRLDTQRETKAGTVRETLDIHIMDELGERPYYNYSGGEQFRIDFALRIALSRLLARRAGAELQTLIIDEGFGTQDAQGRARLVEAIHAIQEEFARVLVITHIEELQDLFPVRIQVTKEPEGSQITLM
jgi:exonuclease SbcC